MNNDLSYNKVDEKKNGNWESFYQRSHTYLVYSDSERVEQSFTEPYQTVRSGKHTFHRNTKTLHMSESSTKPNKYLKNVSLGKSVETTIPTNIVNIYLDENNSDTTADEIVMKLQSINSTGVSLPLINFHSADEQTIIMDGFLLKYFPGKEADFVTRWISLSIGSIHYYQTRLKTCKTNVKTSASVPFSKIKRVSEVSIYLCRTKRQRNCCFEILLNSTTDSRNTTGDMSTKTKYTRKVIHSQLNRNNRVVLPDSIENTDVISTSHFDCRNTSLDGNRIIFACNNWFQRNLWMYVINSCLDNWRKEHYYDKFSKNFSC